MSFLSQVARLSNKFSECGEVAISQDKFHLVDKLHGIVNEFKIDQFNFKYSDIIQEVAISYDFENFPPVSYFDMYSSQVASISLFIIHGKSKIPLHNHPNMYGYLKVLDGGIALKSYSRIEKNLNLFCKNLTTDSFIASTKNYNFSSRYKLNNFVGVTASNVLKTKNEYIDKYESFNSDQQVIKVVDMECISNNDNAIFFTPTHCNIHSIRVAAQHDYCIFIDVLIPPYQNIVRDCTYFKINKSGSEMDSCEREVNYSSAISSDAASGCEEAQDGKFEEINKPPEEEVLSIIERSCYMSPIEPPTHFWTSCIYNENLVSLRKTLKDEFEFQES